MPGLMPLTRRVSRVEVRQLIIAKAAAISEAGSAFFAIAKASMALATANAAQDLHLRDATSRPGLRLAFVSPSRPLHVRGQHSTMLLRAATLLPESRICIRTLSRSTATYLGSQVRDAAELLKWRAEETTRASVASSSQARVNLENKPADLAFAMVSAVGVSGEEAAGPAFLHIKPQLKPTSNWLLVHAKCRSLLRLVPFVQANASDSEGATPLMHGAQECIGEQRR